MPAACADSSRDRRARPPAVMSPVAARPCRCTDLHIYCTQQSDQPVFASTQQSDQPVLVSTQQSDPPRTRSLLRSGSLTLRPHPARAR